VTEGLSLPTRGTDHILLTGKHGLDDGLESMSKRAYVEQDVTFIPSATFVGAKPGLIFTTRAQGVGYYTDPTAPKTVIAAAVAAMNAVPAEVAEVVEEPASKYKDEEWEQAEDPFYEVQEEDGSWQYAILYNRKDGSGDVCLWFGDDNFEGLDGGYKRVAGQRTILDSDGDEVPTRTPDGEKTLESMGDSFKRAIQAQDNKVLAQDGDFVLL